MQYSSILTSPAVGRRTAVTIASMNGHAGVFQSEAPVGHPKYSATAPGVSRFPPPSLPLPYHMLLGKNSGFVTHPVHQRWSCSASVSCKLLMWWPSAVCFCSSNTFDPVKNCLLFIQLNFLYPQSLLSKSTLPCSSSKPCRSQRFLRLSTAFDRVPSVNVNPFTPKTVRRNSEHHKRKSQMSDDDEDDAQR